MKIIVGLGNIGSEYKGTRHNVGFYIVEALKNTVSNEDFGVNKSLESEILRVDDIFFVKPRTYMNTSGRAVKKIVDYYKAKPNEVYVIHDDLDITLGEYKVQLGKGPKVHNGVNSIEEALNTSEFWRVRVGIENRDPNNRIQGETYVLSNFESDEKAKIDNLVLKLKNGLKIDG